MGRQTTEELVSLALRTFKINVGPTTPVSRATLQLAQTCQVNRTPCGGLHSPSALLYVPHIGWKLEQKKKKKEEKDIWNLVIRLYLLRRARNLLYVLAIYRHNWRM